MLPQHTRNHKRAAVAVNIFEANLFGPQSRWSSLLGQRERLQIEIKRGRRHLEQLRKDLAECGALVQAWPTSGKSFGGNGTPNRRRAIVVNESMEEFLSGWLTQLEARLSAVTIEIEAIERDNAVEPAFPEESMFALLRAAG